MNKFSQLITDMGLLLSHHWPAYLKGIENTLILAIVATVIGCVIGLLCGILTTIPCSKKDRPVKRFFIKLINVIIL